VGSRTVVWLNEAQHYLQPAEPGLGERIAAGLRTLLAGNDRNPILILGTIWPEYWHALTSPPDPGSWDPYPHVNGQDEVLSGGLGTST
jgi:hypothetical protein